MWRIKHIFETTSNREIIGRFLKANKIKFYADKTMPRQYSDGLSRLTDAVSYQTHIAKKDILEALHFFTVSETKSDLYGQLFSKIGKVICFYLLSNRQAMEKEVKDLTMTSVPRRISVSGALQQAGRAAVVIGGICLAFVPALHLGGLAMAAGGTRLPVDDAVIEDPEIKSIIEKFNEVNFEPLYQKISS